MNRTTTAESHHIARRSSATPIHSKPSFNASHLRSKMNDESTASSSVCVTFTKDQKEQLTPYERLLYEAEYDPRVYAEEKAGRRIGFYRLKGNIGLGNFSKVKLGVHLLAREKVAVKILDRTKLDASTQKLLLREIKSIERLHHPNIIRLYEVIQTSTEYYIITEYAPGGELYTRITNRGKLNENEAKTLFAQITAAVDHMHSKGIVHRDIKGENIFYVKDDFVKLGDFGFSTYSEKDRMLTTFCGSPPYAAPELYRDESYNGFLVDLWAMGVLLYFMVTGLMPFRGETLGKLRKIVLHGFYSIPGHVSSQCQEIIRGLLQQEPSERWTIKQIRYSDWLHKEKFPEPLEPLPLNLTNFWTCPERDSGSSKSSLDSSTSSSSGSSFECAAQERVKELGITSDVLEKAEKYSRDKLLWNHDSINGTYRLVLHRLQKQASAMEHDDQYNRSLDEEFSPSLDRFHSVNENGTHRKKISVDRRRASHDGTTRRPSRFSEAGHTSQACTIL